MANLPPWRDDFLAVYPYVLERLSKIPQVKKVLEAQDLSAISGESGQQIPLDGVVYVVFDGFTPTDANDNGRGQTLEIGFSIILTKTQFTPKPKVDSVGNTLTAIAKALQGFDPVDGDGNQLTTEPFRQKPALPIQYERGFAYFPLRFTTEVAVIAD